MNVRLKPEPLNVVPDDPFAADCFGLESFAVVLSDLLNRGSTPFVVNLEAPWGQGKSTFLKMWLQQLRKTDVRSLYFNAWENDFTSDPLIALIGELSLGMEEMQLSGSSNVRAKLSKVRKIGARVAARAVPALVKVSTLGMLDLSEAVEEVVATTTEKIAEDEISRYEESKNSIRSFRKALEELALTAPEDCDSVPPLLIVIDELDRCRPDYAIRVLETVKHLFAVPGVFFLVATDSRQLSNAIQHVYGLGTSSEDYLRRFFDLTVSLPAPTTRQFVQAQLVNYGFEDFFRSRSHSELQYDREQSVLTLTAMFDATDCSLRDQQKCLTLMSASVSGVEENHYIHPLLLCPLIVLKIKRPGLYEGFVDGRIGATELVAELSKSVAGRRFFESDRGYGSIVYAYLIAAMPMQEHRESTLEAIRADMSGEGGVGVRARHIVEAYGHYSFRSARSAMRSVLPRIEFFTRSSADAYEVH